MTGWQTALFVSVIVVLDLVVVSVVIRAAATTWNALADRFEPSEPAEPSETRRFQSFGLGILNLGFSVHVTADPDRLHLTPVRVMRWLGMRPMSVPWDAIELKPGGGRTRRASLGSGPLLRGPAWCLDLAAR